MFLEFRVTQLESDVKYGIEQNAQNKNEILNIVQQLTSAHDTEILKLTQDNVNLEKQNADIEHQLRLKQQELDVCSDELIAAEALKKKLEIKFNTQIGMLIEEVSSLTKMVNASATSGALVLTPQSDKLLHKEEVISNSGDSTDSQLAMESVNGKSGVDKNFDFAKEVNLCFIEGATMEPNARVADTHATEPVSGHIPVTSADTTLKINAQSAPIANSPVCDMMDNTNMMKNNSDTSVVDSVSSASISSLSAPNSPISSLRGSINIELNVSETANVAQSSPSSTIAKSEVNPNIGNATTISNKLDILDTTALNNWSNVNVLVAIIAVTIVCSICIVLILLALLQHFGYIVPVAAV